MNVPAGDFRPPPAEQCAGDRRGSSWECLLLIALVALAAAVFGHYLLPAVAELLADGIESVT